MFPFFPWGWTTSAAAAIVTPWDRSVIIQNEKRTLSANDEPRTLLVMDEDTTKAIE